MPMLDLDESLLSHVRRATSTQTGPRVFPWWCSSWRYGTETTEGVCSTLGLNTAVRALWCNCSLGHKRWPANRRNMAVSPFFIFWISHTMSHFQEFSQTFQKILNDPEFRLFEGKYLGEVWLVPNFKGNPMTFEQKQVSWFGPEPKFWGRVMSPPVELSGIFTNFSESFRVKDTSLFQRGVRRYDWYGIPIWQS